MPDKPVWYDRLDQAIEHLNRLPYPFVDRPTLEFVLGVGRRRAQQILQPLVRHTVGRNGLAPREEVIAHLRALAAGDRAYYEKQRRQRLHSILDQLRREALQQPRVLVEAPTSLLTQAFDELPPGVLIEVGRITIEFDSSRQALEKLLALAMAIGNDLDRFDALTNKGE